MKAFAQVADNTVTNVISVHDADAPTEAAGLAFLTACGFEGTYVETYTDGTRGQYAAIGDLWDGETFTTPSPAPGG